MNKKWIATAVITLLLLISSGVVWAEGRYKTIEVFFERVQIIINGQYVALSKDSLFYNGTIYIPLKNLGELMGANVLWESSTRSVNLDFSTDNADLIYKTSQIGLYNYISIQNNQIMNHMITYFKKDDMTNMKNVVRSYEKLGLMAEGMQDSELADILNKLRASTELLRSAWASKNLNEDYTLSWVMYINSAKSLNNLIKERIKNPPTLTLLK
ncbi:MAG TPA: stalk domain-containing protein [Bacilli bacterium]